MSLLVAIGALFSKTRKSHMRYIGIVFVSCLLSISVLRASSELDKAFSELGAFVASSADFLPRIPQESTGLELKESATAVGELVFPVSPEEREAFFFEARRRGDLATMEQYAEGLRPEVFAVAYSDARRVAQTQIAQKIAVLAAQNGALVLQALQAPETPEAYEAAQAIMTNLHRFDRAALTAIATNYELLAKALLLGQASAINAEMKSLGWLKIGRASCRERVSSPV